jgi:hypothetical protein
MVIPVTARPPPPAEIERSGLAYTFTYSLKAFIERYDTRYP